MSHRRLYPWVMVCLLPRMPPVVFARFDNPADPNGYVQALKQLIPGAKFLLFFVRVA
ncbi:hypothetical protein BJP36_40145 [Moorena producens JHB]|uniref:Uncharacterized protein n=1 Tax=Moorena producens (strain JHB) TaxID=1454205 RepID=A0A9Q9SS08_MOOP1|nr:hypothetical protein [Moorena producens]WAN68589.1 hypothetical protein BJP36_40145 [Moorena producens JHB]